MYVILQPILLVSLNYMLTTIHLLSFIISSFFSENRLPRKLFSKVILKEDCISFLPVLASLQIACSLASTTLHLQIPRPSFGILDWVILLKTYWNMLSTIVNSKFVMPANMPKITSYHFCCLCQEHLIF